MKISYRILFDGFHYNRAETFRQHLASSLYLIAGVVCFLVAIFSASNSESALSILPCALGLSILILPIMVVNAYLQSSIHGGVIGRSVPASQRRAATAGPVAESQRIRSEDLKLPKITILISVVVGLLSSCTIFFATSFLAKSGIDPFAWLLLRLMFSVLAGAGTLPFILAVALSHNIQRARERR